MKRLGFIILFILLSATYSLTAGTPSGTVISNKVTVKYDIGAQKGMQTEVVSSFVVDNKVNVVVTLMGSSSVTPGQKDCVMVFSVTNAGNTPQRYKLEPGPYFSSDPNYVEFTNVRLFLDKDNSGTLTAGDIPYGDPGTFGDIQPDQTLKILLIADAPDSLADGNFAQYYLMATTVDAGTLTETKETQGANTSGIDVVFADGGGIVDINRDGRHSAMGVFTVKSAVVNVIKEATIISDPLNPQDPKPNRGAVIRYTLTVTVTGEAVAEDVVIKDTVPAETDYVSGSITLNGNPLTDGEDSDQGSFSNNTVFVRLGNMTNSTPPQKITFDVRIK